MKTKSHFLKIGTIITFSVSLLFFSCDKQEEVISADSELNVTVSLKSAHILPPEELVCDLLAGQTINVGKVIYSNDGLNLYVTYLVNSPWVLTELHFYAGTLNGLPRNKTAIQIGHFPYDMDNLVGNQLIIPLSELDSDDGVLTLAAHAVVVNGGKNETAWANCTYSPIVGAKVRFSDQSYALTDGPISYAEYFSNNSTHWCSRLGLNIYEKNDGYLLQSNYYTLADAAGTVQVSDDGNFIKVKISATVDGEIMTNSYLFVGSINQLGAITIDSDGCPKYANFPYVKNDANNYHEQLIPIPIKSMSFKAAFKSNRWGWISSYKL